jgi:hypothetical protein
MILNNMIDIFKALNFIKSQWLGFIVILLWIFISLLPNRDLNKLKKEDKKLDTIIVKQNNIIDTIYKDNIKIKNKIQYINKKQYDTIKIIDTMSTSELQKFFTDRYNKKDSCK